MNRLPFFLSCLVLTWVVSPALAQIEIAYVDSEYIYSRYPEFATAQQQLDRLTAQWTSELENRQAEVDQQFREYQARELLYTQDERQRKQEEIMQAEQDLNNRRMQYFGPEGELYRQQDQMLRPIQEKVLIAVETVATAEEYDYVFDRSGDYIFLYANDKHDISDLVLEELGIEVTDQGAGISAGATQRATPPEVTRGGNQ